MALSTRMLNGVTTDTTSAVSHFVNEGRWSYGLVQVALGGGTGTIAVQGRTSSDMPWFTIATITADDAQRVSLFPQMRIDATSLVGATVTVELIQ